MREGRGQIQSNRIEQSSAEVGRRRGTCREKELQAFHGVLWELHVHGEEAHGHSMGAGAVAVDVDPAPDPAPPFMCHCGMFLH